MSLATTSISYAASGTWTNLNGGNWSAAVNWLNGVIADGADNTADFSTLDLQTTTTVTLDTPRTIGNITFGDIDLSTANGWIISNGGVAGNSLTLSNSTATPLFTVNAIHGSDGINNSNDVVFKAVITGQQGWIKKGTGCLTPTVANAVNLVGPVQLDEGLIDLQQPTALAQGRNLIFNGGALAGSITAQPATLTNIILTTGTEISSNSYTATRVNFGAVPFIGNSSSVLKFEIGQEVVTGGTYPGGSNAFVNFNGTIDFGNSSGNWRQDPGNGGGAFGSRTATFNLGTNTTFVNSRAATAGAFHTHYLGALKGGPRTQLRGSQQTANALVIYQIGDANLDTTFEGTIRDGAVSGGAATYIVKSGTGKLTLTGTNIYTGTTVINSGALVLGSTALMNSTPSILVNTNGTFDVSAFTGGWSNLLANQTLSGNGTVTGSVAVAAGFVSPGASTNIGQLKFLNDYSVAGTMTNLFKIGTGTNDSMLISGNLTLNDFTATVRVVPTGSVINNGTYPLFRWGGTLAGDTNNLVLSYPAQPGTLTLVTNLVTKTISLSVVGANVNNLTWSGNVSANNWDHSTLNWNNGTTAFTDLDSALFTDSGVASVPVNILENISAGALNVNNTNKDYVFNNSGGMITGANGLTKSGPGKLTLLGDNDYAGTTTVNAGTLQVGNGTTSGSFGAGSVSDNGTLIFNRPTGFDLTLASQISGSGTLIQNGTNSTLTLTANNSFNGGTIINAGTLQLGDGNSASGSIGGIVTNNSILNYFYNNTANIANSFVGTGTVNFAVNGAARQYNLGASPTSLTNNGFTGTINVGPLVALHVPDQSNGTNQLGNGSTVIVAATGQLTLDRNGYYNSAITLSGNGNGSGVTANMAMDMAQGATLVGNVTLAADASIGGFLGDVTISGRILGTVGNETLTFRNTRANATSINMRLGSTSGPNNWGNTIIDPGDNLNQIIRVTALTSGALSTNALTIGAHGILQLNGNNLSVSTLASGAADGAFNATILNANTTNAAVLTVGDDLASSSQFDGILGNGASQPLGLTKVGNSTLILSGDNTNTGPVTINGGTLSLVASVGSGSCSNATPITISSGAVLDVTARSDGSLNLQSDQTLKGNGGINGNLVTLPGSIVNPGSSIGTLTVSNNATLGGTLLMEVNRAASPNSDHLVVSGTLTAGGTLQVTNIGGVLQVNDTFQLFPSGISGFAVSLPANDTLNNVSYTWQNNVVANGSVKVLSVTPLAAPVLTNSVLGNTITFSWSGAYKLQSQTNSLSVGLSSNWSDYPGGGSSPVNVTINPANPTVFFRLSL
jgi:fibronectin-binding autotransporter adhesin